ncbi:MAG: InlB B-repeat-containing protein, partial [Actinomycetes bacterium]
TAANGSGTAYGPGATFSMPPNAVTLYAQWSASAYAVTYDPNTATGGTAPVDPGSPHATDSSVSVLGNTGALVKTGYTFTNWNTAANGSGTAYGPGATFSMQPNAVTLYAQWTALPPCVVGASGPGGGTIFYNDTAGGKCYEYAPNGWNVATPSADPALVWALNMSACYANIATAQGTAVGTGQANTAAITGLCATAADAPAAWAARNYGGGGLHDWFLPSLDELNQLCKYARGQSTAAADQATVCDGAGTLAPGFTAQFYWTSSQAPAPANFARGQDLGDGLQGTGYKDIHSLPVRPVWAWSTNK